MVLKCYMLELIMVLDEEEIGRGSQECVRDFNYNLQTTINVSLTSSKRIHLRVFA